MELGRLVAVSSIIRLSLLIATIGVLGVAFVNTQTVDFERHAEIQTQLETLRQLEQSIDRDILEVRAGLRPHNGSLVVLTKRMMALFSSLSFSEDGQHQYGPPGMQDSLAAYEKLLKHREGLLLQFNSQNKAVVHSLRDFPTVAEALIHPGANTDAALKEAVSDFSVAVLHYYISAAGGQPPDIGERVRRLRWHAKRVRPPVAKRIGRLLRYGQIIVAHRAETDFILKEILSVSGLALLTDILNGNQNHLAELQQESDANRIIMFAAALVLVAYIALTLVNLMQVRRDLQAANVSLENRIADISRAKEEAELADRSKSEFLAMMSHELRTPLNAVIGFSELIRQETFGRIGNKKYLDYAKDINDSAQHLLSLINDILDLSKIESGTLKLDEEALDVAPVVTSVETLVRDRANRGSVSLRLDCPADLPALYVDARKLKQMLVNLLSNAIKFTEAGGKAYLKVRCDPEDGYLFEVGDTGIGMAADDIPKAMTPFMQVDSSLGRKHEGTGLGLPLTRRLIELHGGSLTLESEPGLGTVARLIFTADRVLSPGDASARSAAEPA